MGSLLDNLTEITQSNLYYNKYQYKAQLGVISGAWFIHNVKSLEQFEEKLKDDFWLSIFNKNYKKTDINSLKKLVLYKQKHLQNITIRVEGSYVSIFSNDLDILREIEIDYVVEQYYKVNCIPKIKFFKNVPKFMYRTYFDINNNADNTALIGYLHQQRNLGKLKYNNYFDTVNKRRWNIPKCYVDYNEQSVITFLSLVHNGKLKETYKLEWVGNKDKYI